MYPKRNRSRHAETGRDRSGPLSGLEGDSPWRTASTLAFRAYMDLTQRVPKIAVVPTALRFPATAEHDEDRTTGRILTPRPIFPSSQMLEFLVEPWLSLRRHIHVPGGFQELR